jgi:hypothetical protein
MVRCVVREQASRIRGCRHGRPRRLRCRVTASNSGGNTSAESVAVTATALPLPVPSSTPLPTATPTSTPPPPPTPPAYAGPTNSVPPRVAGTPAKGKTLDCKPGQWTGKPKLAYQWLRDGVALRGRTESEYRVRGDDVGHVLSCRVTARNALGVRTATSAGVPSPASPSAFGLPADGPCVGPDQLTLRLRAPRLTLVKSVELHIDGRRRLAVRGRSLPAVVKVRGLPSKRFELSVRALRSDGGWAYASRSYDICED